MLAGNQLTSFSMIGTLVINPFKYDVEKWPNIPENLTKFTTQDFKSMFGHLWTLCIKIKRLIDWNKSYMMSINYTRAYFRLRGTEEFVWNYFFLSFTGIHLAENASLYW